MTDALTEANRDPECPGPNCPMCNGEMCNLCGAGCWRSMWDSPLMGGPRCEHSTDQRHMDPVFGDPDDF